LKLINLGSHEFVHVQRHFLDLRRVVLLNVPQNTHIRIRHEVNRDTFAVEAARTPDPVDVELTGLRQIVANHEGNLLDVETAPPHICSDQNSRLATSKLVHDSVSLLLRHRAVHMTDCEVGFSHLPR